MVIAAFVLVIQAVLFLVHLAVYKTFVHFAGIHNPGPLWWTRIIFLLLSVSFLAASFIAFRYYGPWVRMIYIPAAVWIGTVYLLLVASVLSWAVYWLYRWFAPGRSMASIALTLMALAVVGSAYGVWNSYRTKVRNVAVKLENLPESWRGRRAVLVADTHLGNVRNVGFSRQIADLISKQQSDIVLIPGDFFDGTPANYKELAAAFGNIQSRFGVYLAPGNHEDFRDRSEQLTALGEAGVHVLVNGMENVDGLQVIGVDWPTGRSKERQTSVLANLGLRDDVASVLIKHEPSHIDAAETAGIGLQVSGHTHNGQMFPVMYITKMVYGKFYNGLHRLNTTQVYTTSGAGTWGPPQRLGANPEIVVITFE